MKSIIATALGLMVHIIMWPPTYYVMRDRIPFFLSIVYLYRHRVPKYVITTLGWYLALINTLVTGTALGLYLGGFNMMFLAGINWSAPSPIEWGTLIIAITAILYARNIPIFEASYLSLLAALSGGWIYEISYSIPHWVNSGFAPWNWLKINAIKVFFIEFQVLCLPILLYLIKTTKTYKTSKLLLPAIIGATLFYGFGLSIAPLIHKLGTTAYMWTLRVPTQITLFLLLYGIQGNKGGKQ